ncbi:hypothetical protein GM921_08345 [Pedobacter sp. LMG 31464]|uniref:Uncharacterized protein n=1 Tax=Pedobacter planticolens TaxID=2679964 RepID=A0A923DWV8_9SPHI|nr:hypothetical protein [Pedobacter planticolens]MBB2145489.1 hypothetical protein [Pedobacter planticolens]
MKKRDLFVHSNNIMELLSCKETKSFREMRKIKKLLGITAPRQITVDHACFYYGITEEQYWRTQQRGNKDKPTDGAG